MKGSGPQLVKAEATSSTDNARRHFQRKYYIIRYGSFQALRDFLSLLLVFRQQPFHIPMQDQLPLLLRHRHKRELL